jgi:hypothetical protein
VNIHKKEKKSIKRPLSGERRVKNLRGLDDRLGFPYLCSNLTILRGECND